ncbi:type IV pilus modification protein PilV [Nitrosococcus watsonii]|uniref:Type IV pilus modification protein PilV n=1 Tax=Nitrosococcus watsoni (strain C-113) TaxID=105559 RepID=D8K7Q9_NITWC|nr:type IV pilus modification protein PilV [Nitrosococcus watsonii]ADJ28936.1 type IV pilus modification protein PilV [Nitrosococcus watsonii C-113]
MKHHFLPTRLHPRSKGFSLLEVLISVAILSIGLLGLAGLQATGMRSNHSAYLRSQATLLAYDIVDRMRANRTAALNNSYSLDFGAPPATPAKNCAAANCEAAELAAYDLHDWFQNFTATLPSSDGEIQLNAGVVTVTVQWDETWTRIESVANDNGTDPITRQFVMSTQL